MIVSNTQHWGFFFQNNNNSNFINKMFFKLDVIVVVLVVVVISVDIMHAIETTSALSTAETTIVSSVATVRLTISILFQNLGRRQHYYNTNNDNQTNDNEINYNETNYKQIDNNQINYIFCRSNCNNDRTNFS